MTATVLLTCDRCGAKQSTTTDAYDRDASAAARRAASFLNGWAYVGGIVRIDLCSACWAKEQGK